jgi:spermidine synthase
VKAFVFASAIAACAACADAGARVIHTESSLYQNILVIDDGTMRCLQFSVRKEQRNQSCRDATAPRRMVFPYTRMMLAALLLDPSPRRVLIVGLGGGTLPTAFAQLYPDARIDVVEIDPAVTSVAERYFDFSPGPNTRVYEQDARVWTKRALAGPNRYDLVMLDAFNGDYIPEHLMTQQFLEEARGLLTDDGTLAANTFSFSRLYDSESVTYTRVFGTLFNFKLPGTQNRVIIASRAALPDPATLGPIAKRLAPILAPYGVPIERYPSQLTTRPDWRVDARVLTDQYSPANLLRGAD